MQSLSENNENLISGLKKRMDEWLDNKLMKTPGIGEDDIVDWYTNGGFDSWGFDEDGYNDEGIHYLNIPYEW
jgi:hypothetical protein